jgi:hypothetical protein
MSYGTIIQQGNFTSTGVNKILVVRSDIDWFSTLNMTAAAGTAQWAATRTFWQRGMADNNAFIEYHAAATDVVSVKTGLVGINGVTGGYKLINTSASTPGAAITITDISVAGVVLTGTTTGLVANSSIVRINNAVGAAQLGGIDYMVTAVNVGVSFTIGTAIAAGNIVAANAPGATAAYQVIPFDPIFYPSRRVITNITAAAAAVVTTSVPHGYRVGQVVRLNIPPVAGAAATMSQINGLLGEITVVGSTTTFTVNIDSSTFTAFTWPVTANAPFTPPYVTPVGEGTDSTIANPALVDGAKDNVGYIGIQLAGGISMPAGANLDDIFWKAGKSFNM